MVADSEDRLLICDLCVGLAEAAAEDGQAFNDVVTMQRGPGRQANAEAIAQVRDQMSRLQDELNRLQDKMRRDDEREPCSFCGSRLSPLLRPANEFDVTICTECLPVCREMGGKNRLGGSG
jgi:hypothetical protein